MGNAHDSRIGNNPNAQQDPTRQNIQGAQNLNTADQGLNYSEKDLEYVEFKETDEAYGEIRVYRLKNDIQQQGQLTPTGQSAVPPENIPQLEIGIKSKIFDSQEESTEYLHGLNAKKVLKHPNVVPFLKINSVTNSNLCTSIYKIDIGLEFNRNNIETELLHRFQTKEFFAESSIFDMIEQVMSALQYLKQHNISHGDIQPRTILFGPNDEFKITDVQFLTNGMCGYRKHLAGIETECFLAPELLQPLRRQNILADGEIDQERADIFSLGLVALAASILQSVESVYNFEDYCLREEEMLNHLDLVKTHYSNDLYLLLVSMLNQVDRRVDLETGLNLIGQMRSGQFNQEEYELKRFQSELQNSEKKLAQSSQYVSGNDRPSTHPDTALFSLNPSNPQQPTVAPNVAVTANPLNSQIQAQNDKELAYAQEQEILKRTAAAAASQPALSNQNPNQQYQQLSNSYDIHSQVTPAAQQSTPNQQALLTPSQYLHENTLNNPRNLVGTLTPSNKNSQGLGAVNQQGYADQQKSDRYDNHPHQFVQSNTNSQPISVNGSYQAHSQANNGYPSNVYPAATSAPISNTFNSHNLDEIDARVREALLRSQQVSLKFENSPLRQFRDQLLADELYIPQDVNQSLSRSRQQLSSSAKKNPQISQSQSKAYQNYPMTAGSGMVGAPVRKFVSDFPKKQQSQQGSRLINQKWRI